MESGFTIVFILKTLESCAHVRNLTQKDSNYFIYTCTCSVICNDGDLRLANGANTSREGRIEICSNEVWGTVCDDSWDDIDASVVCYQLGYGRQGTKNLYEKKLYLYCCLLSYVGTAFSFAFFGQGTGPILLDDVGCTGTENRLIDCSHSGVGQHNCVHFEDAGVRCGGELRLIYILPILNE